MRGTLSEKQSVVIADVQYLTATSLAQIVRESNTYTLTGIAQHNYGLEKLLSKCNTHLLITDFEGYWLNDLNAFGEFLKTCPTMAVLLITNQLAKNELAGLTSLGIKNIIYKTAGREEILAAMDAALKGKKYYGQDILELLIDDNLTKQKTVDLSGLTSTEAEIVRLIASGLTTKEIAAQKHISIHTVMSHRKNIFRKMGVNSISELIMQAIKAGWIDNIEYYI
jgi:DNA-binding NarL/FixJ family response regulator